ncbi:MAG: hypothetical protein PHU21_09610, partial [Elusimicrobia bacterium]|nr:hypothetical protein [Elusimicrobiota bacterium]
MRTGPAVSLSPSSLPLSGPLLLPAPQAPALTAAPLVAAPAAEAAQPTLVESLAKAMETPQVDIFDDSTPGVKVCGVNDEASVSAALGAASQARSGNLVIGLLVGIRHYSREKVATKDAPGLVRHIRETSSSLGVPVKIAFVTHHVRAASLIGMIGRIARRIQPGKTARVSP